VMVGTGAVVSSITGTHCRGVRSWPCRRRRGVFLAHGYREAVLPKSALPSPAERGGGACHLYDVSHIWTPLFLKILVQATIWVSILFVA
jgi:hypothetical protein